MQRDGAAQRRSGQENLTASGKRRLNWLQLSLAVAWGSLGILRPKGRGFKFASLVFEPSPMEA